MYFQCLLYNNLNQNITHKILILNNRIWYAEFNFHSWDMDMMCRFCQMCRSFNFIQMSPAFIVASRAPNGREYKMSIPLLGATKYPPGFSVQADQCRVWVLGGAPGPLLRQRPAPPDLGQWHGLGPMGWSGDGSGPIPVQHFPSRWVVDIYQPILLC